MTKVNHLSNSESERLFILQCVCSIRRHATGLATSKYAGILNGSLRGIVSEQNRLKTITAMTGRTQMLKSTKELTYGEIKAILDDMDTPGFKAFVQNLERDLCGQ